MKTGLGAGAGVRISVLQEPDNLFYQIKIFSERLIVRLIYSLYSLG